MGRTIDQAGTSRYVKADGITLHYHDIGEGPVVVWVHGGGLGANSWGNYAANLPAFVDNYRNLLFDMPSYGKSDKVRIDEPVLRFNARKIVAALDELGVEKARFIGNSMGGGTTTAIAVDHPERVERLVLMGSVGIARHFLTASGELPAGVPLIKEMFASPDIDRGMLEKFLKVMCYDHSLITEELLDARLASARQHKQELEALGGAFPIFDDLEPDLGRITAPTLLLWAREDNFVTPEAAVALQRGIADATLVLVPSCGHWIQYERRELFNKLVTEFFRGELA